MRDWSRKKEHVPVPRLGNDLYYDRHRFLRVAWLQFSELFTIIEPNQQWDVHAFYQPSKELTKEELIAHRKVIAKERPTLSAVTGKHFDVLYRCFRVAYAYSAGDEMRFRKAISQMSRQRSPKQPGKRQIRVSALAHPEPDLKKLSQAFVDLAIEMSKKQKSKT